MQLVSLEILGEYIGKIDWRHGKKLISISYLENVHLWKNQYPIFSEADPVQTYSKDSSLYFKFFWKYIPSFNLIVYNKHILDSKS